MLRYGSLFNWLWFFAIGLATSAASIVAAGQVGVTFDEPTYLEHGLNFWHTGSHRPLMKLGTMPLPVDVQTFPIAVAEWMRGEWFDHHNDIARIIVWMRYGNLVFWWILLYFGMRLARELGGPWAGRVALTALACEPNLLAHAALATTDIAVTAALLAFVTVFHNGRDDGWRRRIAWPGVWCGVALLSKASALAFCPLLMIAVEIAHSVNHPSSLSRRQVVTNFLRDGIGIGMIGFAVAFAGCGSDFLPNEWFVYWAKELPDGAFRTSTVWLAEHLCVFSNAGEAIATQIHHNLRGHGQYLFGEADLKPFWFYFPLLFMVKMTVPVLAGAAYLTFVRYREIPRNAALLAFAILLLFSLNCRVQLGIRLQFPAVALLIVGLAVAFSDLFPLDAWRRATALTGISLGLVAMAWAAIASVPHGLSYANVLWGDSARAHFLVGDSNYDWGQGLRELDLWHQDHNRPGLDVWYFGQDPFLKTMPVRDLPLHCVPLAGPEDMPQYIWGRKLAVSTSIIHGWPLNAAHRVALDFISHRRPIDRTRTFLIYDFSDIRPPVSGQSIGSTQ
jgi:hypothetical protein